MKIIICSKSTWNVYNFRENLIKRLIIEGNEIYIFAKKDKNFLKLKNLGCKIINIPFDNRGFNIFLDIFVIIKIYVLTYRISPDIFLSFNIKPIIFSGLICKILNIRNIHMITGLGTAFLKDNILQKFSITLYKYSLDKKNIIFFQNKDDLNFFFNKKIIKTIKYQLLPGSGIDLIKYSYSEYIENKVLTFLFIGRLLKSKGINEFLIAAEKIRNFFPKIKFQIAGDLVNDKKDKMNINLFNKLILNNKIEYIGLKKNIISHIVNSDCVVLPSYREGTPRSLLESLSLGRPIITSDAVGCKEVIINNKNGYICKKENALSLEKSILKFINLNHSERVKMSMFGRKFVEENFDENFVIQKYLHTIKTILLFKNET